MGRRATGNSLELFGVGGYTDSRRSIKPTNSGRAAGYSAFKNQERTRTAAPSTVVERGVAWMALLRRITRDFEPLKKWLGPLRRAFLACNLLSRDSVERTNHCLVPFAVRVGVVRKCAVNDADGC